MSSCFNFSLDWNNIFIMLYVMYVYKYTIVCSSSKPDHCTNSVGLHSNIPRCHILVYYIIYIITLQDLIFQRYIIMFPSSPSPVRDCSNFLFQFNTEFTHTHTHTHTHQHPTSLLFHVTFHSVL